jgi:FkbM family methyltransferase
MAINDILISFLAKNKLRGKDRLYGLLVKLGFRGLILYTAKYGIKLNLNPHEYIDDVILKSGFYESEITEEILKHIKNGDVFWDIGANIGIHSLAIKRAIPGSTVYSFEPNPKTLGLLYDNVKLNNLDIKICGFALYDKAGLMDLHIADGNSGMSTLTPWHALTYSSTAQCLTTTGDFLLQQGFETPTVIKLDTEGSELNILNGCKDILSSNTLKVIILEAKNDLLNDLSNEKTISILNEYGFHKVIKLSRNEDTHHGLSNFAITRS